MCRLFGMVTGARPARATFWLIDAPDSLTAQSHAQPDGTGLGWFDDDGIPWVDKAAIAAWEDTAFALEARELYSANFLAHIRFASTGGLRPENTHPFIQDGRMLAHNGVIEGLGVLERELGDYRELVGGDTDSERFFALVTKQIDAHGGDVGAGLAAAAGWVAAELPLYSLNVILASGDEQWALRYPERNNLFILERGAGGPGGSDRLEHTSATGRIHVRCGDLAQAPAVIFATEPMDDDPGWRNLDPGELVHVDAALNVRSQLVIAERPRHELALGDLHKQAAESQRHV
ncbi:MAG TPA: class II glutamine amidotransferase [Thermoleophilaceae bacterium]